MNINIKLPDGGIKEISNGSNGLTLAKDISNSLAKSAIGLKINGEYADLMTELKDQDTVQIITAKDRTDDSNSYEFLRHTTAHILACAVQRLYPTARIAIGPVIENGFYYDFFMDADENGHTPTISTDDLPHIEAEMRKIISERYQLRRKEIINIDEMHQAFLDQGERFKAELLDKYRDNTPTLYEFVDGEENVIWSDLCRGPHLPSTGHAKAIKLMSVSSAYWHGDENLDSLQRVYGTAWWSEEDLIDHLHKIEEAERRDHRKISKQHQLFSTHDEAGPGLIFWHPKLGFLRTRVEEFWREIHEKADYEIIYTPHIARKDLWDTSGHTEYYMENMFQLKPIDEQEYILKPMNCPFHTLIYDSVPHSYRELPIRYAEMGTVYRYERSGALHGLARVRGFTQDDAHVFCTPDQLIDEVCDIIRLIDQIYQRFGLSYSAELSTRPDSRIGGDEIWDMAESALQAALSRADLAFEVNAGDGAFYGPKIDFKMKDALGRVWQGATIQVDFNLPERFDLTYRDADGQAKRPVMLHRAIFGSLERFTALLIENYAGVFPLWLSQTQVKVLPIADRHHEYAQQVAKQMKEHGIRAQIDPRSEKVQAKIRDAQLEQIPYMLILGDNEADNQLVAVRERRQGDMGNMSIDAFIGLVSDQLKSNVS